MRKLALALALPAVLAIAACGADTKSCSTAPAQLTSLATGCTLAAGTKVSLAASAFCDTCAHTSPSCLGETLGSRVELNPVFQDCTEDQGCTGGCSFPGAFACTFTTPAASGPVDIQYPSRDAGGLTTVTVNVASSGSTSCGAFMAEPAPAP